MLRKLHVQVGLAYFALIQVCQVATHPDVTHWLLNCCFEASNFAFRIFTSAILVSLQPDVGAGMCLTERAHPPRAQLHLQPGTDRTDQLSVMLHPCANVYGALSAILL